MLLAHNTLAWSPREPCLSYSWRDFVTFILYYINLWLYLGNFLGIVQYHTRWEDCWLYEWNSKLQEGLYMFLSMVHGFFIYWEFHSEAKERAPSTFQLQPIIITQDHNSSVILYLALVTVYPSNTQQNSISWFDWCAPPCKHIDQNLRNMIYNSFHLHWHLSQMPATALPLICALPPQGADAPLS